MKLQKTAVYAFMVSSALAAATPTWAACDVSQTSRTPIGCYVINGGSVYDQKTDLTWARCSVGQHWQEGSGCVGGIKPMTWDEALQQVSGSWRVPTKDELETLISPTCKSPAINEEAFPNMEPDKFVYWTSTKSSPAHGWVVLFDSGGIDGWNIAHTLPVRLVRDGR